MTSSLFALLILLASCAPEPRYRRSSESPRRENALKTTTGIASYYAHKFHGRKTASGQTFNMHELTAAHRTYPFGTRLRVVNLDNHLAVVVVVNDRGPFAKNRIIDLSLAAAEKLDMLRSGTARVRLEVLEWGQ